MRWFDEDEARTAELKAHGYRVIRFWNSDVIENLAVVLDTIDRDLEPAPPHPTLSAPPGGEGISVCKAVCRCTSGSARSGLS